MATSNWQPWGTPPVWWGGDDLGGDMPHQYWFTGCPHCKLAMRDGNEENSRYRYIVGFSNERIFCEPEDKDERQIYWRDGAATIKCPRCQKLSSIHIDSGLAEVLISRYIERDYAFLYWPEAREAYQDMVAVCDKEE